MGPNYIHNGFMNFTLQSAKFHYFSPIFEISCRHGTNIKHSDRATKI